MSSSIDDESGEDQGQDEPEDIDVINGIMDKRGLPEFSKVPLDKQHRAKFAGEWRGMVFKRGPLGVGYYRDVVKHSINLVEHITAVADAVPIRLKLCELVPSGTDW